MTPENYTRAIASLSRRFSSTSVFPGSNYVDIREWLLQDRSLLDPKSPGDDNPLFLSKSKEPHDLLVVYNSAEKKWELRQYSQDQHKAFSVAAPFQCGGLGQIIFIRGFISPSWVSAIGSKYSIDPEFFRRHMDFLSASIHRHAYGFPSLASSSDTIFRLCVNTIFHRDDFGGQDLRLQRSEQSAELEKYKIQQLRSTKICCGDSLVREYSTMCPSFSVLEQWISLYLAKTERGWAGKKSHTLASHVTLENNVADPFICKLVIVWMDQGRPLEKSPPGPWTSHLKSKATALPVLQHHHKMAFRTTTNRLDPDQNASAEVQQGAAVLPLQYDSLMALVDLARRAPHDPASMCIPLFAHSAFSEVQFLNLVESRIHIQMTNIAEGARDDDALGTLQYFSNILIRHAQQLGESTRALSRLMERSSNKRPSAMSESSRTLETNSTSSSSGAFTPHGLLQDYEQLQVRCLDLSKMCSRGMTLAMNKATIEESRRAIEQSDRLKRLTLLATFFIPLSFSSSLFGMNVDVLGQSEVRLWWFFVLCIPITLCAYIVYLWDFRALRRFWTGLWKECCGVRRGMMRVRDEKDVMDKIV